MPVTKHRLAIFISGRGSNMENILKHFSKGTFSNMEVAVVVSDNPEAKGLEVAQSFGVPTHVPTVSKEFRFSLGKEGEQQLSKYLIELEVTLICLAGFMRIIKHELLNAYSGHIINIHPSLLPQYPGLHTHERAIADKQTKTGATVHLVDAGVDTGRILKQVEVPILENDTPESLSRRVLAQEHPLYIDVLTQIDSGLIQL